MRGRWSVAIPWLAVIALSCTTVPEPALGVALPRHGWSDSGPAALGVGRLRLDQGCLFLQGDADGTSYLVVWPPDTAVVLDAGAPAVRIGGATIRLGDQVQLGGGFYSDLAFVAGELRDSVLPPACITPEVFMATEVVPPS